MTSPGLRERKKARTRSAIQAQALRLFAEQGYEATTVEQIAEAAEVSPSTFFRYFPTKEDVVLQDEYDPLMVELFARQPPELTPLDALRRTMVEALGQIGREELEQVRARTRLIESVPALRARTYENLAATIQLVAEVAGRRLGLDPADFAVQTFAGSVLGTWLAVIPLWLRDEEADLAELLDRALAQLQTDPGLERLRGAASGDR